MIHVNFFLTTLFFFIWITIWNVLTKNLEEKDGHSVMRVGSDTFGDPIFQKGL